MGYCQVPFPKKIPRRGFEIGLKRKHTEYNSMWYLGGYRMVAERACVCQLSRVNLDKTLVGGEKVLRGCRY